MMTESAGLVDSQDRAWRVMEREDGSISIYYTRPGGDTLFVVFDTLDASDYIGNKVAQLDAQLVALQAENEDLKDTATRIRIANTALMDVCKEAERYIGGIPDDRIDGRDADPILDKLDWAITQAEGWAADRAGAIKAMEVENEALRAALELIAAGSPPTPYDDRIPVSAADVARAALAALAKWGK